MEGRTTPLDDALPAGPRHIIKRPRLTRILDETDARIIMLVAPAGYGKTTLARQWLAEGERRFAWCQTDAASRDLAAFARGVARAMDGLVRASGESLESHLRASPSPEVDTRLLAQLLARDFSNWPTSAWLVIDDYHRASVSTACDAFADALTTFEIKILLLSRSRPAWTSARRRLYGEIAELDRRALALTDDEATAILGAADGNASLIHAAEGWPALIGVAALAGPPTLHEAPMIPDDLFEYFVAEMMRSVSDDLQRAVSTLALAPRLTSELCLMVLGTDAELILADAVEAGFLSHQGSGVAMHPLIRRLLLQHARTAGEDGSLKGRRVASALIDLGCWDDAFELVVDLRAPDLFEYLLCQALDRLLDTNRLSTLDRWISFALASGYISSELRRAEAEIALRRGHYSDAEALASDVLSSVDAQDSLRAKAHLIAARSTNLLSREAEAFVHADEAFALATDQHTRGIAAWMRISIGFELERNDLTNLYQDLDDVRMRSYDHTIRLLNARSLICSLDGCATDALLTAEHVVRLARRVADPMLRTSFYNRQASALQVAGHYDAARLVIDEELAYASRCRLEFVLPYALVLQASIELGVRNLESAHSLAADALRRAPTDPFVNAATSNVRARILLTEHCFKEAAAATSHRFRSVLGSAFYGEYLATHAMALACLGHDSRALSFASQVERLTRVGEGRCLARAAQAVVALHRGVTQPASALFAEIESRGCFDVFVTAYRAEPALIQAALDVHDRSDIQRILVQAKDIAMLDPKPPRPLDSAFPSLTRRELEVVALLAESLTNREIADHLFISEKTAKVHVRHILAKLEARSRTEAAVKTALLLANLRERRPPTPPPAA